MAEDTVTGSVSQAFASCGVAGLGDAIKGLQPHAFDGVSDSVSKLVDVKPFMPDLGEAVKASLPDFSSDIFGARGLHAADFSDCISVPLSYWHQLVVIGNGFDLECGLPSRFKDFFESRHPQPIRHEPTFGKTDPYGEYRDDNAWELILNRSENHNWYDVEGTIADWIGRKNRRPADLPAATQGFDRLPERPCAQDGRWRLQGRVRGCAAPALRLRGRQDLG